VPVLGGGQQRVEHSGGSAPACITDGDVGELYSPAAPLGGLVDRYQDCVPAPSTRNWDRSGLDRLGNRVQQSPFAPAGQAHPLSGIAAFASGHGGAPHRSGTVGFVYPLAVHAQSDDVVVSGLLWDRDVEMALAAE